MKRVLCVLLSLCLTLALTGCMSQEERAVRKEALSALSGNNLEKYALSTGTTLDNQELYSDGNITIRLAGITGDVASPELKLAVRNGTRQTLNFYVSDFSINGWQADGWLDLYNVEPRTITMGSIQCGTDLTACGIEDVVEVELGLEIYDEDYNTIASVSCVATTSSEQDLDLSSVPEGITLLEEDGVTVKAVDLTSGSDGTVLTFYVQNDTGRVITLSAARARCNGDPVELWFYDRVGAGCRRMVSQWIYAEDTYANIQMEEGDQISFQIDVQDWETGIVLNSAQTSLALEDF